MIVKHMSFSGRVRLSSLCKSWRSASMRREIPTCPQLPWLVHPQPKTGDTLSFSSLSEGKVFKSRLPSCIDSKSRLKKLVGRTNLQTSYFLESSRGWLFMLEWEFYFNITIEPVLYLVNPVSGARHRLPPLETFSGFKKRFVDYCPCKVVLSSPDVSKSTVAAVLGPKKLILCRPGDKSWSVFQLFDEDDNEGIIIHILFSSTTGILYALVRGSNNCGREVWIESHCLKLRNNEVNLKVIYDKEQWWIDDDLYIQEGERRRAYLTETANNELLLIYHIQGTDHLNEDVMEDNVVDEEGNNNNGEGDENNMEGNQQNESVIGWVGRRILRKAMQFKFFTNDEKQDIIDLRTKFFRVYKIDQDNRFRKVHDLGDQILFLAEDSSSLSLLASNFKGLRGNCIYFATRGIGSGTIHTSREIGIFYLDSGKIERCFPSFEMGKYSRLSWFMPNLW